jgi:Enoyl-CoA hydratase/isomerase
MVEPKYGDVSVTLDGNVAQLEIHRPPHNFFDFALIRDLANAFEALDETPECRALMLCSEGKSFCAGANFANRDAQSGEAPARTGENPLYVRACGCSDAASRSSRQFRERRLAEDSDSRWWRTSAWRPPTHASPRTSSSSASTPASASPTRSRV